MSLEWSLQDDSAPPQGLMLPDQFEEDENYVNQMLQPSRSPDLRRTEEVQRLKSMPISATAAGAGPTLHAGFLSLVTISS